MRAYIYAGDYMKNKEKDYVMRTVGFQAAVSLIILATVFSISKLNPSLLEKLSGELLPLITVSLTKKEAEDAFKDIREILFTDGALSNKKTDEDDGSGSKTSEADADIKITESESTDDRSESTSQTQAQEKPDLFSNDGLTATVQSVEKTKKISLNLTRDGKSIPASASNLPYSLNAKIYSPLSGKVTSEFGERVHPVYDTDSFHSGIDIAGNTGDNIRCIADGKVIRASYDKWNGHYLEVEHGNGITTMYCHCSKLLVKAGASVKGGEAIAQVGSTGVSTGPHLHFEFRIDGISYNPSYALSNAADAV